jgi:2-polyprenyl-6-hydroxyphenyl methylase/3-demethylubiquinone-9 3-methyltransferase
VDHDYYDQYWESLGQGTKYDDPTTPHRKVKLAQALGSLPKGSSVLDLGCGKGDFTAHLAQLGFQAVGTDISELVVEKDRRAFPQCRFEVLNADGSIPARDGSFQAVWSSEVIEHIFDVHAYLSQVNRVLVDGGLYVLTTPYHGLMKNMMICLTKFDHHFDPELSHIRFFDKAGLQRCLNRAGFEVVKWDGIGRMWKLYRTWFVIARKSRPAGPPPEIRG